MAVRAPGGVIDVDHSTEPLHGRVAIEPADDTLRIAIVVHYEGGAEVALLDARRPVIVGRAPPSDLQVPDAKLSRQHARFSWQDGRVQVEDLGSRNGTWVGEQRVEHATIELDGEVMLGGVVARIHDIDASRSPVQLDTEARFRRCLDDEVARARHTRRGFTLLAVSVPAARDRRAAGEPLTRWVGAVRGLLRPFDRLGSHGSDTVLILLPEAGPEIAEQLALVIAAKLGSEPAVRRVGVASFPDAATTGEKLIELACHSLAHTSAEQPIEHAPGTVWVATVESAPGGKVIAGAATRELFATVQRVAAARAPVILHGETGTGKEVIAHLLHQRSPRRDRRIVRVNCGAIPSQLLESTLFGHEKGAFTGAAQQHKGVFEEADRGTVFLDEIGELPLAAQTALLRVLETGCFTRVGASRELAVDVRVIAATHRDLRAMVASGGFREDLYYRLDTITLAIPPLRERTDEIEPLALDFLRRANAANGCAVRGIESDALGLLQRYGWPGNIRELRNIIERAVVVASGDTIGVHDLPARLREATDAPASLRELATGDARTMVQRYETQLITDALEATGWSRTEAAKKLGMPLRTLAYKIKTLGLKEPR